MLRDLGWIPDERTKGQEGPAEDSEVGEGSTSETVPGEGMCSLGSVITLSATVVEQASNPELDESQPEMFSRKKKKGRTKSWKKIPKWIFSSSTADRK